MPKLLVEHATDIVPIMGGALVKLSGWSVLHRILLHVLFLSFELPDVNFLTLVQAYPAVHPTL